MKKQNVERDGCLTMSDFTRVYDCETKEYVSYIYGAGLAPKRRRIKIDHDTIPKP